MKVDLEKIHIGVSPLTGKVFIGTIEKAGVWRNKRDITDEFIGAVIQKWEGFCENLSVPGSDISHDISVKKIDKSKNIKK